MLTTAIRFSNGVVRAGILQEVTHQVANHHLVVRLCTGFGRFGAIRGHYEKNPEKISLERQAHFEKSE